MTAYSYTVASHAEIVTTIDNINVDGTMYTATLHAGQDPNSFNAIWDADGNGVFGDDASVLNRAPEFLGNAALAEIAAHEVVDVLGIIATHDGTNDSVMIPFQFASNDSIDVYVEDNANPAIDVIGVRNFGDKDASKNPAFVWVSFEPSPIDPLDVDGNGQHDALTDGLLIIRYLFGFRGTILISDLIGAGATRTTVSEIENHLDTLVNHGFLIEKQ